MNSKSIDTVKLKLYSRLATFVFAVLLAGYWLLSGDAPAPVWWFIGAFIVLIESVIEARLPSKQRLSEQRRQDLANVFESLEKERGNFQQIIDAQDQNKTFSGLHQKAVEVYSYKNAKDALALLSNYRKYRRIARLALKEINSNVGKSLCDMRVHSLINRIEVLVKMIRSELGGD